MEGQFRANKLKRRLARFNKVAGGTCLQRPTLWPRKRYKARSRLPIILFFLVSVVRDFGSIFRRRNRQPRSCRCCNVHREGPTNKRSRLFCRKTSFNDDGSGWGKRRQAGDRDGVGRSITRRRGARRRRLQGPTLDHLLSPSRLQLGILILHSDAILRYLSRL